MASGLENEYVTLHEIVKAAKTRLNGNIWDYLIGGTETESTLRRNRMALDSIAFKPRVLRNVSAIDPSSELLGKKLRIPVVLAPVGSRESFEAGGGGHQGRQRRGPRQRRHADQLGDNTQARGHREGRQRPQDLPALCARRR